VHLPKPLLMLVTDRHRCSPHPLMEAIELAVAAGIDALQLREKDLEAEQLYDLAVECRRITAGHCIFLVNGRLDIAQAAGADGVHLPEHGLPVQGARRLSGPGFLIGRSVHSASAAVEAEAAGADYVELGTIFATDSKPGLEPSGLGLVRETATRLSIPGLAVGGVDARNAPAVIASGASGIAVVSAILQAGNVGQAVANLRQSLGLGLGE
jgi:thiamine-phosphate pyrophosphorylase